MTSLDIKINPIKVDVIKRSPTIRPITPMNDQCGTRAVRCIDAFFADFFPMRHIDDDDDGDRVVVRPGLGFWDAYDCQEREKRGRGRNVR